MLHDDPESDEWCNPNNPRRIKYDDIVTAARRITGAINRTPCVRSHMSEKLGVELYLKQENLQYTGSFKERGARNALLQLSDEESRLGVITASTGNHGLSMAEHCRQLGITCVLVFPAATSLLKIAKCEAAGARVIVHGRGMSEAKLQAMTIAKDKRLTYINGYDHPHVIEGAGTIGLEIIEQVPAVDAVLIPVGGGALLAGVAAAIKHLKPDTEIYGIETDKTNSMVESLRRNERVTLPIDTTIAEALAIETVGVNTFHTVKGLVDKMVVVKEDWVARAIMHIVEEERCLVEGGGAAPVAALLAGLFPNLAKKRVVAILSGGNIDCNILTRVLEKGMAAEGRLVQFKVTIRDRPGAMAELCGLLSSLGVTLRDAIPERAWLKGDVFSSELTMVVETRSWDHTKELQEGIKKHYKESYFPEIGPPSTAAGARRGPCLAPNPVCMQK